MGLMAREISNIAFQLKTLGKNILFDVLSIGRRAPHKIFINSRKLVSNDIRLQCYPSALPVDNPNIAGNPPG